MKFENRMAFHYPQAYWDFVLNVGDGGAGPYYGAFMLLCGIAGRARQAPPCQSVRMNSMTVSGECQKRRF